MPLLLHMQTYNPEMAVFGVVKLTFTWEDSG